MKNYQALNAKNWLKIYAAIRLVLSDRVTYIYLFIHTWDSIERDYLSHANAFDENYLPLDENLTYHWMRTT